MTQSILITAGGTSEPIDAVRVITNRSTGKTGVTLANFAHEKGWGVDLLLARSLYPETKFPFPVHRFETVEELGALMKERIRIGQPTGLVHSAAVSDYVFDHAETVGPNPNKIQSPGTGKISGHLDSIRIILKPAPRLLAKIRSEWNFRGILVSFKLETDPEKLLIQSKRSLMDSGSDMVVGNTWGNHEESAMLVFGTDSKGETPAPLTIPRINLNSMILDFIQK